MNTRPDNRRPVRTRSYRFFVPELAQPSRADLSGVEIHLPEGEARHAGSVLRVQPGQAVELFDGLGLEARGRVIAAARRAVTVLVDHATTTSRPAPLVHLAFAVPKGKRLDWLIEKATELGAASLRPMCFERSVSGRWADDSDDTPFRRWQGQCVSAAKQSGLSLLPEILPPLALAQMVKACPDGLRLLGEASPGAISLAEALDAGAVREVTVVVGPEGGLTADERGEMVDGGFLPVRLGTTTLRVETAAVALLSAIVALTR